MYRIALETILGFTKHGETLTLEPSIPRAWREFSLDYQYGASTYAITVYNGRDSRGEVVSVSVDGTARPDLAIPLVDDGRRHNVVLRLA